MDDCVAGTTARRRVRPTTPSPSAPSSSTTSRSPVSHPVRPTTITSPGEMAQPRVRLCPLPLLKPRAMRVPSASPLSMIWATPTRRVLTPSSSRPSILALRSLGMEVISLTRMIGSRVSCLVFFPALTPRIATMVGPAVPHAKFRY